MVNTMRVGIYGASGYAGQNLIELLVKHPNVTLIFATSNTYAEQKVDGTDLHYIPSDEVDLNLVDVVFLALPHNCTNCEKSLRCR